MLLVVHTSTLQDSLAGYPQWFVVACLTVVAALAIWILGKLLKWAVILLLIAVLLVGGGWALWLLFQ